VARAIACQPEVIVADEPTGNLDPYNAYEIVYILQKLNKMGKTIILASHDKDITNKLGKRVITLDEGAVIRDEENGRFMI
jgi:cell division transport system ATP-binding protein